MTHLFLLSRPLAVFLCRASVVVVLATAVTSGFAEAFEWEGYVQDGRPYAYPDHYDNQDEDENELTEDEDETDSGSDDDEGDRWWNDGEENAPFFSDDGQ